MSFEHPVEHHPAPIAAELILLPELAHLAEARIGWLLRVDEQIKAGRQILGMCYLPSVQGSLRPLFDWFMVKEFGDDPPLDFLIVLDRSYWREATDLQREILVYHELMHCGHAVDKHGDPRYDKETGAPVYCIRGHDVEEFVAVVQRYGVHNSDIDAFIKAAQEHT